MSDDLVQRLRNIVSLWPPSSRRYYRYTLDKITDAAHEIERLRAEVATVRTDAHDALCDERAARERAESERDALRERIEKYEPTR